MSFPGVKVTVTDGNLSKLIDSRDVGAIVAADGLITPQAVYTYEDAEQKLGTTHPILLQMAREYYDEVGGKSKLWIMGAESGKKVNEIAVAKDDKGLRNLMAVAGGEITLIAIACTITDTTNAQLLTAETKEAVGTSMRTFCEEMAAKLTPVRVLIGAKVCDKTKGLTPFSPREVENPYCAIVLGSAKYNTQGACAAVLGRAVKYTPEQKVGSGRNGSLNLGQLYIGDNLIEARLDLEELHDAGLMTFHHRHGVAGNFVGVDNMLTVGDYRYLAHGRVIDRATRIIGSVAAPYVEDTLPLNDDGTISDGYCAELAAQFENAISKNMSGQISGVKVTVASDQDIVNTSTLKILLRILPVGYATWIDCEIGLADNIS